MSIIGGSLNDGNILILLEEGNIIQQCLSPHEGNNSSSSQDSARVLFQTHVSTKREVSPTLSIWSVSWLFSTNICICRGFYCFRRACQACPLPATLASLIVADDTNYSSYHPVIFEQHDEHVICQTILHLGGAAGPTGVDALGWCCLCTSFRAASTGLFHSLA